MHDRWPAHFPEGEGSDFAGVATEVGDGVSSVSAGAEVIGWTDERGSHAEAVSVPAGQVVPKPAGISWEAAGSRRSVARRDRLVGGPGRDRQAR